MIKPQWLSVLGIGGVVCGWVVYRGQSLAPDSAPSSAITPIQTLPGVSAAPTEAAASEWAPSSPHAAAAPTGVPGSETQGDPPEIANHTPSPVTSSALRAAFRDNLDPESENLLRKKEGLDKRYESKSQRLTALIDTWNRLSLEGVPPPPSLRAEIESTTQELQKANLQLGKIEALLQKKLEAVLLARYAPEVRP